MKRYASIFSLAMALLSSKPALAEFTGDVKTACEAMLCLSSSKRPSECSPAIRRYFSIKMRKFSDTLKARKNFLKLCPSASESPEMTAQADDIVEKTSRCEYLASHPHLKPWADKSETDCQTQQDAPYAR